MRGYRAGLLIWRRAIGVAAGRSGVMFPVPMRVGLLGLLTHPPDHFV